MRTRACTGISVLIALFAALMLASAPRLHDQLHPTGAQHQCAATILASGNCQHTAAQQIVPAPQKAPKSPAFLPKSFQFLVAAIPSSIQEHAPPTSR